MKTVELMEATAPLSEYAQNIDQEPVILTLDGEPVAALISLEKIDLETIILSNHPEFLRLIERSRARQKAEGGISSENMRQRLGLN